MSEKKKFIVTIEEMVSEDFEIIAENEEKAEKIATEKYNNGEFVLEPGNLVAKQMQIHNVTDDKLQIGLSFNEFTIGSSGMMVG